MGDKYTDAALREQFAKDKRATLCVAIIFCAPLIALLYWHNELVHHKSFSVMFLLAVVCIIFSVTGWVRWLDLLTGGQVKYSLRVLRQAKEDKRHEEELRKLKEQINGSLVSCEEIETALETKE